MIRYQPLYFPIDLLESQLFFCISIISLLSNEKNTYQEDRVNQCKIISATTAITVSLAVPASSANLGILAILVGLIDSALQWNCERCNRLSHVAELSCSICTLWDDKHL